MVSSTVEDRQDNGDVDSKHGRLKAVNGKDVGRHPPLFSVSPTFRKHIFHWLMDFHLRFSMQYPPVDHVFFPVLFILRGLTLLLFDSGYMVSRGKLYHWTISFHTKPLPLLPSLPSITKERPSCFVVTVGTCEWTPPCTRHQRRKYTKESKIDLHPNYVPSFSKYLVSRSPPP